MNTDAWLFPYSWVHRIFITSLKIKVHVSGMSSLKIYNPLGEVDASVHFPLFGLEAQKGSWFAFGNYEIAIKLSNPWVLLCNGRIYLIRKEVSMICIKHIRHLSIIPPSKLNGKN